MVLFGLRRPPGVEFCERPKDGGAANRHPPDCRYVFERRGLAHNALRAMNDVAPYLGDPVAVRALKVGGIQ
jgi:hypothetical protein